MNKAIDWEQKAVNALDAIAEKLGMGVDHFWPMFVKEQVISGVAWMLFGVLLLIIAGVSFIKIKRAYKEDGLCTTKVIGYEVLLPFCLILGTLCITANFSKILNPEYHALRSVMKMMKQ